MKRRSRKSVNTSNAGGLKYVRLSLWPPAAAHLAENGGDATDELVIGVHVVVLEKRLRFRTIS
jgi:hypothetical protein